MTLLSGAENIGFLPSVINLANIVEDPAEVTEQEYTHMNMASMYILARVATSQCMGLVGSGFKNMKASRTMMARRFTALPDADPPLDALPYITPQTLAYALSLVMSCVCYSVNDPMTKGRAAQVYEKILANYSKLSDKEFQNELQANIGLDLGPVGARAGGCLVALNIKHPCNPIPVCCCVSIENLQPGGTHNFMGKVYTRYIPGIEWHFI